MVTALMIFVQDTEFDVVSLGTNHKEGKPAEPSKPLPYLLLYYIKANL